MKGEDSLYYNIWDLIINPSDDFGILVTERHQLLQEAKSARDYL